VLENANKIFNWADVMNTSELLQLYAAGEQIFRKKLTTHTSVERDLGGIDLSGSIMWEVILVIEPERRQKLTS